MTSGPTARRAGETLTPSLSLTKAIGRVAGRILLNDVSTHEGITVSLEGSTLSTTTTVTGDFSFEGVPAGAYVLSAQKGRYTKARQNVNVLHGQTTSISLSLTKLPPHTLPSFLLAVQGDGSRCAEKRSRREVVTRSGD